MNSKRKRGEKQIQYVPTATFHPGDKLLLLLGGEPMTIDPAEAKTTFLTAHKLPSYLCLILKQKKTVEFTFSQVMIWAGIKDRDYLYNQSTAANLSVLSLTFTMVFEVKTLGSVKITALKYLMYRPSDSTWLDTRLLCTQFKLRVMFFEL